MTKEKKLGNPTPKPGESQKDFIARCIPYVKKEKPELDHDAVVARCYGIWRSKHGESFNKYMESMGYKLFTDSVPLHREKVKVTINMEKAETETSIRNIIAIVGDRFMNGGFFPMSTLKTCYKLWENTLHDINHAGTHSGTFMNLTDITKFIGYHKNVILNEDNKSVSMELIPYEKTKEYPAWKAFVELCEMAGLIPNVSVTYYGKIEYKETSELPEGTDYKREGFKEGDKVPVLTNVIPVCVSTVLEGRCNDQDGCGIRDTNSNVAQKDISASEKKLDEKIENKRQEIISWLKKNDNNSED